MFDKNCDTIKHSNCNTLEHNECIGSKDDIAPCNLATRCNHSYCNMHESLLVDDISPYKRTTVGMKHKCDENLSILNENISALNLLSPSSQISHVHIWHKRLAHAPFLVLQHIEHLKLPPVLTENERVRLKAYESCHKVKQTRLPFPHTNKEHVNQFRGCSC